MYPNPNNGNFSVENLSGEEFTGNVVITDILGKVVLIKEWTNTISIDIKLSADLKPSLYFIQIKNASGENIFSSKFMFN